MSFGRLGFEPRAAHGDHGAMHSTARRPFVRAPALHKPAYPRGTPADHRDVWSEISAWIDDQDFSPLVRISLVWHWD